jgi:Phage tail sheath protein.
MALGGGTFLVQNKVLPGTYINFISAARASASLSDRGVAALPLELDWGADDAVFTVTAEEFQKDSLKFFGYSYDHDKMKGLRDLFKNIHTGHFYKLMNAGVAASNTYCTAKYKGVRGNDLKTVIAVNADDVAKRDVSTYLGTQLLDKQTVLPNTDNLADNDWVVWKTNVALAATAGLPLTLGSNGNAITGTEYQSALDAFESYNFNTIGCLSTTAAIIDLVVQFTKRLRDTVGVKFQAVVYRTASDYEGIISVENKVNDAGVPESSLVYWVTGAQAGCAVNKSLTNKKYDGEFAVDTAYKQSELEAAIQDGKFAFHKVGDSVRVLEDINTFITVTDEKSSDFSSNQTIRILDQIANDIASLFNTKYLGNVPNDAAGRISLWNDIVSHHQQLQTIRAIEDFNPDLVVVEAGSTKKAVVVNDVVTPVNAMAQLYMTVVVQ